MENTIVSLRVRPIPLSKADPSIWTLSQQLIQLNTKTYQDFLVAKHLTSKAKTSFKFDHCFTPKEENSYIYSTVVKPLVFASLKGINMSIFMYGQTGSGKTYTMLGQNLDFCYKDFFNNNELSKREIINNKAINKEEEESLTKILSKTPKASTYQYQGFLIDTEFPPKDQKTSHKKEFSNEFPLDSKSRTNLLKRSKSFIGQDFQKPSQSPGVLNYALHDLFKSIQADLERTFILRVSYIEIYNENVYDLLKPREKLSETLQINEDTTKGFYIKGLTEEAIGSIEEVIDKLRQGEENRHYAQTVMNHTSSRSHTVFRIKIKSITNKTIRDYRKNFKKNSNINNKSLLTRLLPEENDKPFDFYLENNALTLEKETFIIDSLMNFVDLGGSEKVSNLYTGEENEAFEPLKQTIDKSREKSKSPMRTHEKSPLVDNSVKERVKEGQYINKSLFFLTQVLSFRTESLNLNQNLSYIPYRNSALTKILKSSLGSDSKVLIICCVTPALSQFDHTMSTLRFGINAKRTIGNKKNEGFVENNQEEEDLRGIIAEYQKKIDDLEKGKMKENLQISDLKGEIQKINEENERLKSRVYSNNAKNALFFLKKMPLGYKKEFLDQMREDIAFLPSNGMVFMTKNNKKYGLIDPERKNQSLKADWQDLLFDYQGVFAMKNYKIIKEINKILMEKFTVFKEKIEGFSFEFIRKEKREIERFRVKYQNMMRIMNGRFRLIAEELQKNSKEFYKAIKRLEIFEKYQNFGSLNDSELEKLEKHLLKGFDLVKDERFRRKYGKDTRSFSHQNISMDGKDRLRKKNYESIMKIIENFLNFEEIQEEIDFDIDGDCEEIEENEAEDEFFVVLKEKYKRFYQEIMKDVVLEKKIAKLEEYELDFHKKFEINGGVKRYEELGLYQETSIDDLFENFVEDKEYLGENLKKIKINTVLEIISPLEMPFVPVKEPSFSKEKRENVFNSYEDLLGDLNTSVKEEDFSNKETFLKEQDDVSFEDRSQKIKKINENMENFSQINCNKKKKEIKKINQGKLSLSLSSKILPFENEANSLRGSTPHKLEKLGLNIVKDFQINTGKQENEKKINEKKKKKIA